mgnify:FL=1
MKKLFKLMSVMFVTMAMAAVPVFAGNVVIKGSTTVLPIAQATAEAFMAGYPDMKVSLSGGGSGNGIKAIIDGTADIGNASRFIKDKEVELAMSKGVLPVPHRVALDCIAPVVHPSNGISDLTMNQIQKIYKGEYENWSELGGADKEIVVVSRDSSSGTFGVWKKIVMDGGRVVPSALTVPSNGAVVQAVAKTPNAIGYIGLGYMNKDVKGVSVGGVDPTEANTVNGSFPISRPLFMFTNGWPKGDTMAFLGYVLSQKGQDLVKEAGSIPLF